LPPVLLVLSVLELSWSLSDEEKKIILDEHNKYRSQVSPPAQAMMKMTWDTDLELGAQNHARKCFWSQNGSRVNLFATASALYGKLAIEEWNEERKFYNLTTSECVPRQTCDNYSQVPAAGLEGLLGQELYQYPSSSQNLCKRTGTRGNMKGKKPYVEGPSCEMCPTGTVCENNLCEVEAGTGKPLRSITKE
ncbi:PI16 inhibitor, partial [Panurus biarmicus]|nr:PI16 inhibitor [Panurus biarmicus]